MSNCLRTIFIIVMIVTVGIGNQPVIVAGSSVSSAQGSKNHQDPVPRKDWRALRRAVVKNSVRGLKKELKRHSSSFKQLQLLHLEFEGEEQLLCTAVDHQHREVTAFLLESRVNPNSTIDDCGQSVLVRAAQRKDLCIFGMLLEAGAHDKAALAKAIQHANAQAVCMLLDQGHNPYAMPEESEYPDTFALVDANPLNKDKTQMDCIKDLLKTYRNNEQD